MYNAAIFLIGAICLSPLVLVLKGRVNILNPIALYSLGCGASILGYLLAVDYVIGVETILFFIMTYLIFTTGVIMGVQIKAGKNRKAVYLGISHRKVMGLARISLALGMFFTLYVFYSLIASSGSIVEYFANMMAIRTMVANPSYDPGLDISRPGVYHILSISFLYVYTTFVIADLIIRKDFSGTKSKIKIMTCFLFALMVSINDVSRGRILDVFIMMMLALLFVGNKKDVRFFITLVLLFFIGMMIITILQGKAENFSSSLMHFARYFGLPLAYFDRDYFSTIIGEMSGDQTFHAVYNAMHTLGFDVSYVRTENRGVTLDGYQAVLIYPAIYSFLIDYGLVFGYFLFFLFSIIIGIIYNMKDQAGLMGVAIYICCAVAIVNMYGTWRLGDNYFIAALLILMAMYFFGRYRIRGCA